MSVSSPTGRISVVTNVKVEMDKAASARLARRCSSIGAPGLWPKIVWNHDDGPDALRFLLRRARGRHLDDRAAAPARVRTPARAPDALPAPRAQRRQHGLDQVHLAGALRRAA